jgi:riboflavin kinase
MAVLRRLASMGAMHRKVSVTSADLARSIEVSQQAASASLIRLHDRGYLERAMASRGQMVRLTVSGIAILKADYLAYRRLFDGIGEVEVSGTVASGLGEGGYYLSRRGYREGLERLLGAVPFKGTLNVRLSGADLELLASLRGMPGEELPGFVDGGRTFGPIKCFKAEVGGIDALVVIPARTHYTDVMELVAPVHLRIALRLAEGKAIKFKVRI